MSLQEKAGQLMVVEFSGTKAPEDLIERIKPGGIIYFSENLTSDEQIAGMTERSQIASRKAGEPLLVMIDQEGGPVTRLPGTAGVPGGAAFDGDAGRAREVASGIGENLGSLGINVDLAPIADVDRVGSGVIGRRSFSSDPEVVAQLVRAQVCGFHASGVAATAKHFPGHGSTRIDSHAMTASIRHSLAEWERIDLPPFAAAVDAQVDLIMVGHLAFTPIDPSGRPATISAALNRDLLRERLGFDGVVITDALNMGGVTSWGSPAEIAVRAIEAGNDLLLMSPDPQSAVDAIVEAVESGRLSVGRVDESVARVLELKQALGLYVASASLPDC